MPKSFNLLVRSTSALADLAETIHRSLGDQARRSMIKTHVGFESWTSDNVVVITSLNECENDGLIDFERYGVDIIIRYYGVKDKDPMQICTGIGRRAKEMITREHEAECLLVEGQQTVIELD